MGKHAELSDEALSAFHASHPDWARSGGGTEPSAISKMFAFKDYPSGIAFAVRIAFAAEKRDHHPDLYIGWGKVRVIWSTHDSGGVTKLDTEMAEATDQLYLGALE